MYELVEEASKVLRTPPLEFDFENPSEDPKEIESLLSEAMDRFGGIGLSANQVGLDVRCFVMKTADAGNKTFLQSRNNKTIPRNRITKRGVFIISPICIL